MSFLLGTACGMAAGPLIWEVGKWGYAKLKAKYMK